MDNGAVVVTVRTVFAIPVVGVADLDHLATVRLDAPVRGEDFQIVKQNGSLEAPAVFQYDGRYNIIASGATGWAPNKQTYYTADSMLGNWTRGVEKDDVNENTWS